MKPNALVFLTKESSAAVVLQRLAKKHAEIKVIADGPWVWVDCALCPSEHSLFCFLIPMTPPKGRRKADLKVMVPYSEVLLVLHSDEERVVFGFSSGS